MASEGETQFRISIKLTNTSDPVVTRLISVPGDLNVKEFHCVIKAVFDLDQMTCNSYWFRPCIRDPLSYSNALSVEYDNARTVYYTKSGEGFNIEPAHLNTHLPIKKLFETASDSILRFWTYCFEISRFHHAIEILQRGRAKTSHILFLGGSGHISYNAWQLRDLGALKGVRGPVQSTWGFDVFSVQKRLAKVQKRYYSRTEKDAPEDTDSDDDDDEDDDDEDEETEDDSKSHNDDEDDNEAAEEKDGKFERVVKPETSEPNLKNDSRNVKEEVKTNLIPQHQASNPPIQVKGGTKRPLLSTSEHAVASERPAKKLRSTDTLATLLAEEKRAWGSQ